MEGGYPRNAQGKKKHSETFKAKSNRVFDFWLHPQVPCLSLLTHLETQREPSSKSTRLTMRDKGFQPQKKFLFFRCFFFFVSFVFFLGGGPAWGLREY